MTKVTAEEIKKRMDGGQQVTVVDSRAPHAWDDSDVKAAGAVRIPPDDVEKHVADLSPDDYVVVYCT